MTARLNEGAVAVVAASLLFLLPIDFSRRQFTISWNDAAKIDWGTILLFGAGITLGSLLGSTGLAETMGGALSDLLGVSSLLGLTLLATVIAVIISAARAAFGASAPGGYSRSPDPHPRPRRTPSCRPA
ncbi:SLC13 family permease [Georgenia sp. SUBG003]|uniref:SLC13 family permease n=1 Tax=Georgenia sp. SUBG003 TaxID=1497974 RepID=UPI003AB90CCC